MTFKIHQSKFSKVTPNSAAKLANMNALVKDGYSILQAGAILGLSKDSAYRYYYGYYAVDNQKAKDKAEKSYNRMRFGACCSI